MKGSVAGVTASTSFKLALISTTCSVTAINPATSDTTTGSL